MASEIQLYDDQLEFVHNLRAAYKNGNQSVLGVASTGMGKTIVSAYIAKSAWKSGKRVWFVCHRKNLLHQTSVAFWSLNIPHGQIASGRRNSRMPVQVATIGTLGNRLEKMKAPDLLIVDEAHLAMAETWKKVVKWAIDNGSLILGNSATPERLDGKGLGHLFDTMVEAKPMWWLIENRRLSEYVIYTSQSKPDLSAVKTRAGDYSKNQLSEAMDRPTLIGDAAAHWKKHAYGKRTICYCVTIEHSINTANHLNECGIPAVHVDGTTPDDELKKAIRGFADGKYKVICNVELMTTGFDLSAQVGREVPIEACILLRPTQSLAMYMQMVGRALRMKEDPAVILDHAGNVMQHGLPCDERDWSLEGRKKTSKKVKEEEDLQIQQCKSCFAVFRPGPSACPSCRETIEKKKPRQIEQVDGQLEEVDVQYIRKQRKKEQGKARTLRELVALGVRRGMNKPGPWACITMSARESRKPTSAEFKEAKKLEAQLREEDTA